MKIKRNYLILSDSEYSELSKTCELLTSADIESRCLGTEIINSILPKEFSFSVAYDSRCMEINSVINIYNQSGNLLWVTLDRYIRNSEVL